MRSCLDLLLEMNEERGMEKGLQQGLQQGAQQGLQALRTVLQQQLTMFNGGCAPTCMTVQFAPHEP